MFKDLNEFPPSDDWFPYGYIDSEVKKKVEKTKGQLTDEEMEKETKLRGISQSRSQLVKDNY